MRRVLESPLTAWVVLALGVAATVLLWHNAAALDDERAAERLHSEARQIQREIDRRMHAYVQLLRGAEGLFAASVQVDRDDWSTYVARIDLAGAYPLLGGLGFLPRVTAAELAEHEAAARAEGLTGYTVRPAGRRDEYFPLTFVAPKDPAGRQALGFDMASDPARRAAMNRARDLGLPSTSAPLAPIVPTTDDTQHAIVIFVPLYRHGAPVGTVDERRAASSGFVFGGFRIEPFLRGIADGTTLHVRLYDGEAPDPSKLLADSETGPADNRGSLSTFATFDVPGRKWTLRVTADQATLVPSSRAGLTAAAGIIFDLLLFFLVSGQVRLKRQASLLARRTTAELERSRDELAASLAEKDVLLAEVHHRVKNNLQVISSLIQMQARRVGDKAAAAALTECRGRVNAIALIHEKLYEEKDVGKLGFGSYVRSLVDGIVRAAHVPTQLVRLDVCVPDVPVPVERAIPCGLLLNELVTNALEHAFPDGRAGTLRVELREEAGGVVVLAVADDGIGLPLGLEPAQSPSLGLRLVAALTSQLKARLVVTRRTTGGTRFEVIIGGRAAQDRAA